MTSLIDVIFLLLLFFMLTSTFTRFAEVELAAAGSGAAASDTRPLFLQLGAETVRLNGTELTLDELPAKLAETRGEPAAEDAPQPLIVALRGEVSAQRLTDLLVTLRGVSGFRATVLGAS
ncbi:biopolymer transporter ExbD [Salipiger pacificus]|uniref:Biopolymer transporter ExbD n=2 Tax=Salipiger mangrovisoli TaxID=2865933 RepID=A0ABR9X2Z4_9RHOB|nr:biopolymer transporter ExbD [Salipiger mangrovisoli]